MTEAKRTSRGKSSPQPTGDYDAPERIDSDLLTDGISVNFLGLDNRTRSFSTRGWPLGALHLGLCQAFETLSGPTGSLNTERSAAGVWAVMRRFVFFAASIDAGPATIEEIRVRHIKSFLRHRELTVASIEQEARSLNMIITALTNRHELHHEVQRFVSARRPRQSSDAGETGYDPVTFQKMMSAARSDIANIRRRLDDGRQLMATLSSEPDSLDTKTRLLATALTVAQRTGHVAVPAALGVNSWAARLSIARRVFLTYEDLAPLLVLMVGLSGRNSETIKELPAKHDVIDRLTVKIVTTKRRRKSRHWKETVHWELGDDNRSLHTAGGLYRLINTLCQPSRVFSKSDMVWSVWTNGTKNGKKLTNGHAYPWQKSLGAAPLHLSQWGAKHALDIDGKPVAVSLGRIRTTVLQLETRASGGHLPSSTKGNTQDVLFRNYLLGDKTVCEWASVVLTETFQEIEEEIRSRRSRTFELTGGTIGNLPDDPAETVEQTAFLSCADIVNGPWEQGKVCSQSALLCFSCPNALVSARNLPALLCLREELLRRWTESSADLWWPRFGHAWIAITEEILPRFTPEEVAAASEYPVPFVPLTLLEDGNPA